MIVCRRRAPMFSTRSFMRTAQWAISARPSSVNSSVTLLDREQRLVLAGERVLRLAQDALVVVLG